MGCYLSLLSTFLSRELAVLDGDEDFHEYEEIGSAYPYV